MAHGTRPGIKDGASVLDLKSSVDTQLVQKGRVGRSV